MSQKQYYYDPESCTFVELDTTWRDRARWAGGLVLLVCALTAASIWAVDAKWLVTPEEQALETENEVLRRQLSRATDQMTTLSKQIDGLAEKDRDLYRTLFELEPISEDVRQVGVGGTDSHAAFDRFSNDTAKLLKETAQALDKLERQVSLQGASYRELTRIARDRGDRLRQLPAIRPANGPIVSGYGMRHHPILKVRKMHAGVDFLLHTGTPIASTADGVVRRASYNPTYGKFIDIQHEEAGYMTRYAHLSEIKSGIRRGVRVERGQTIGLSGNTGRSTGPHLHYEVRSLDGRALDPMRFFIPDMTPATYYELEQRTLQFQAQTGGELPMDDGGSDVG
jgi:murein DD-endopeptidase MepM/ murein hydrolase activator NlpD